MALNCLKTAVMVAAFAAASAVVGAQGAPATSQPAPATPGAPQSAVPGAPAPAATPAAEPYSYDPTGRRDPFISLMARGVEPVQGKRITGLAGMLTGELMVRGILRSQGDRKSVV